MPKEKQDICITVSDGENVAVHVPEGSKVHVEYRYDSTEWLDAGCECRPTIIRGCVNSVLSFAKAIFWFVLCLILLGAVMSSCS
ncbi:MULTISPECIES: hypothetical protein [unclassified Pseudodesulfovibrio]|uniref:hypothetical protein n=1 Tax=unclassified Pseudodesulfovibrio TaxID=2661612 RepID=UPI000FEB9577|nr:MULTISPECIES: hypothetical protein [unclassified Pseudodesulfovibrio]MCJ2165652.1 hypothetical protein [Pseudodesulfovibrio sp. S3-i]RWU02918.1 hypothetical protein DWB63_13515 [Pseudodesulfovibrio sp. S3]